MRMLLALARLGLADESVKLREPDPRGITASPLPLHWPRLFDDAHLDRQGTMS
jgi:hypothetical protein